MPKLSKDLQEAICAMPTHEKDKLLLRLVARDQKLVDQLQFELLESEESLEDRKDKIGRAIYRLAHDKHYSPGWLMMDMRSVNAMITYHTKITKDKHGEIELTLRMLNEVYAHQMHHLRKATSRTRTISAYLVKRTQFVLQRLSKLHEDYYIEFEDDVNQLLQHLHTTAPAQEAQDAGIPKQWP
ncbi:hypothetical protein SAMN05421823_110129 [Catalinimonas alkaloidigena]|uniref:Uncharacterized protein n=2 Tax=Catalinimonas alkaloidigena TaxID=1075417 RepID=A0A1G9QD68_9BACT|nr:hypothetical protein SAMN05421823_110129 [Catalinimonas alkaloidigena]